MISKMRMTALQNSYEAGRAYEHELIYERLKSFFELTQWSEEHEDGEPNPEWDRGFQAAMALIKNSAKEPDFSDYHCPDCKDYDCLHCYCVEGQDCKPCRKFIKSEAWKILAKGEKNE